MRSLMWPLGTSDLLKWLEIDKKEYVLFGGEIGSRTVNQVEDKPDIT